MPIAQQSVFVSYCGTSSTSSLVTLMWVPQYFCPAVTDSYLFEATTWLFETVSTPPHHWSYQYRLFQDFRLGWLCPRRRIHVQRAQWWVRWARATSLYGCCGCDLRLCSPLRANLISSFSRSMLPYVSGTPASMQISSTVAQHMQTRSTSIWRSWARCAVNIQNTIIG